MEFDKEDLTYVEWAKKGSEFIFISDNGDTVKYIVSKVEENRDERNNPIEGCGTLFYACKGMNFEYEKQSKDTSYSYTLMHLSKNSDELAQVMVEFEGMFTMFYDKNFNKTFRIGKNVFSDVDTFQVVHHNYAEFKESNGVCKMWWSKSKGLLKYQTRDCLTWTKL